MGDEQDASFRRVRVPDCPARLVVRADEYLDELLRELALIRLGERAGSVSDRTVRLLSLVEETVSGTSWPRHAVRAAAEAALAGGEELVTIDVDLPRAAAHAVERLDALMDEARRCSRSGELLTLPATPEVAAFQHWLSCEILRQLRGEAGGPDRFGEEEFRASDAEGLERVEAGEVPVEARADAGVTREARLALDPHPGASREARRFLSRVLVSWALPALADRAVLPAAELVTNAVIHTDGPMELVVRIVGGVLRVEVHDSNEEMPARHSRDLAAGTGRGLELVDALSRRWGVRETEGGKAVWFEIA